MLPCLEHSTQPCCTSKTMKLTLYNLELSCSHTWSFPSSPMSLFDAGHLLGWFAITRLLPGSGSLFQSFCGFHDLATSEGQVYGRTAFRLPFFSVLPWLELDETFWEYAGRQNLSHPVWSDSGTNFLGAGHNSIAFQVLWRDTSPQSRLRSWDSQSAVHTKGREFQLQFRHKDSQTAVDVSTGRTTLLAYVFTNASLLCQGLLLGTHMVTFYFPPTLWTYYSECVRKSCPLSSFTWSRQIFPFYDCFVCVLSQFAYKIIRHYFHQNWTILIFPTAIAWLSNIGNRKHISYFWLLHEQLQNPN